MMAPSIASPATRKDFENTTPPKDITAISVVPPPISTIIEPVASWIGKPAPIAAAIGSSINWTLLAPAANAESWIAFLSTGVEPVGTQIKILGLAKVLLLCTFFIKCLIISSVTIKSAITPSLKGLIAWILPGVLPNIVFASSPTARTLLFPFSLMTATTEGSFRTTPLPLTTTKVLAVPRSIAMSWDHIDLSFSKIFIFFILYIYAKTLILSSGALRLRLMMSLFNAFK